MIRQGLKRKILFSLSFLLDVYIELSPRSFYQKLYSPLYQRTSISETLSRMARVGEIEKKLIKGKPVLQITTRGESLLNEAIPLRKLQEKPWDKLWRIVIFDIEEKESKTRNMLREKLKNLGFAMWQESVYISPHPLAEEINEFFEEKDLFPRCVCFEASQPKVFDPVDFANRVFHLEELELSYRKLQSEIQTLLKDFKEGNIKNDKLFHLSRSLFDWLENIVMSDPFLPKELSQLGNEREKTQQMLAEFSKFIAKT
ncbi:CRISPR-associated endonuclease Cas2 [Candidatus Roizmanbacteria bacterium]|nr:CRISPR-associated endonuclease Cas2 [Candidatus Roizmanbacteria bacterium]